MTAILGALLVGLTLGLLGTGGSILAVPVLAFGLGMPEKLAISHSLVIVAGIALFGAVSYARSGLVNWRSVIGFALPGAVGALLGAYVSQWLPGAVQLAIFATIMLLAAAFMLRPLVVNENTRSDPRWLLVISEGLVIGMITGLVGVGGGFLIIPALVLFNRLAIRHAVGTSLAIITINSMTGFVAHLVIPDGIVIDWQLVGLFLLFGIGGSILGKQWGGRMSPVWLRRIFVLVLVVIGGGMLWHAVISLV